jgi:hypothetical protein
VTPPAPAAKVKESERKKEGNEGKKERKKIRTRPR